MVISTRHYQRLVSLLKTTHKTVTVVEQSCGGLIQSSIMAQPGSSKVYHGGSVIYSTNKGKRLLLNDEKLFQSLSAEKDSVKDANSYINSKLNWTAQTSVAFCDAMETDYAIAESGATGPTFQFEDLNTGFSVVAVAGKGSDGKARVLSQEVIHSHTANREENMRYFADEAALLMSDIIEKGHGASESIHVSTSPKEAEALQLDRATHLRSDSLILAELEKKAKFVALRGNKILVKERDDEISVLRLALLEHSDLHTLGGKEHRKTFLGLMSGVPVFGVDIVVENGTNDEFPSPEGTTFVVTRSNAPLLTEDLENELALHATAYAEWQRRSSYCSLCGGETELLDGGTCRRCTECQVPSWPRQDPSMICAISSRDGRSILLAHSSRHPRRVHTVLAGFVEVGETLEAAVARETYEETGIRIDEGSVKYVGTQPWPFPQSCMFGFTATADDTVPLDVDTNELVSARWFTREEVARAAAIAGPTMQKDFAEATLANNPDLPLLIPPKGVIARVLIDKWMGGQW